MALYDILMLSVLVGAILFGLWKGLAWQAASLASIFVSYFVALNFRGSLAPMIAAEEPWNRFAAMLILFLGTSLIIWMAYGYMKKTIERLRLRGFDTQAGGLLGALKGGLLCMLITLFAVTLFGANVRQSVMLSKSGGYIATAINRLNAMVPDEIHALLDKHVQQFNQNLNPDWIAESEQKFEQKLQVIRGKFTLPESTPPGRQSMPSANVSSGGINLEELKSDMQFIGDQTLEQVKEAGKSFIEENLNR